MKECDLCNKVDAIHYRVKSKTSKVGFFAARDVGILFQKKANILMGEPGNQKFRKHTQS